jgi:hypothetical protein
MSAARPAFLLLAASFCCPLLAHSQGAPGPLRPPSAAAYENSTDGLRRLMADVLDSARHGYEEKVARSIRDMEIPDFKTWSATTFVQDKAKNWSDAYGAGLERNEAAIEKLFVQLAQLRGQISTRKINDSPRQAEGRN